MREFFRQIHNIFGMSCRKELCLLNFLESAYWIAAKIVCLKLDHGWSHLACNICFTPVDQEGNKYYCSECNKEVKYVIHRLLKCHTNIMIFRYSLQIEALELIGKSAKELNEGCPYPSELDDLIEEKLMFKVRNKKLNIKRKDPFYEVVRFTDDETLLKKLSSFDSRHFQWYMTG
ncbi:hypothetical protein H5410_022331 [Solanum commersonii]|uniref:Uncharacterized protein n=1 Tax=Solanum commersonii TaxID=4109 RepID=A0A9J5ZEH5_SOLCO|nr:hypothetical protein H5410_022331 [Solanum commersonii]